MQGTGNGGGGVPRPSWKYRRLTIFGTLLFDAAVITVIVYGWLAGVADANVVTVIAASVIGRSTAVIGSYVFGAAWDDKNFMKNQVKDTADKQLSLW